LPAGGTKRAGQSAATPPLQENEANQADAREGKEERRKICPKLVHKRASLETFTRKSVENVPRAAF